MAGKNIITINGRAYDAITGMPAVPGRTPVSAPRPSQQTPASKPGAPHRAMSDVSSPKPRMDIVAPHKPAAKHSDVRAYKVHQTLQKSHTLHRAGLKKPEPLTQLKPQPVPVDTEYVRPNVQRSPVISKFGPNHRQPVHSAAAPSVPAKPDQPRVHPVVAKALANRPSPVSAPAEPQSSHELKEALIRERLAEAHPNTEAPARRERRTTSQPRLATILMSSLALLLLAGYLTYINLPNISMRVAAVRAGISANYPTYNPDGYHFSGPITYQPGEVNITFTSNTNQNNFSIKQKASSWDSQAVLDNYVAKKTGTYLTYQERGLTIYSFGNHAAWVNGGLLYTIDGNAPLSSDQLLHIATSM